MLTSQHMPQLTKLTFQNVAQCDYDHFLENVIMLTSQKVPQCDNADLTVNASVA